MIPTLRVLACMGTLHRLLPFWLAALALLVLRFEPWLPLAVFYGFVLQFLVEYAMHRFLLHRAPPQDQGPFEALYRSHVGHHEFPAKPEFFTGDDHWYPVRFGLLSVAAHVLVLWPLIGLGPAALFSTVALFLGSVTAFAFYEYCHTLAHLDVPKGPFGRRVTHSHLRHHFNDHDATFHVSFGMGWIDRLFGTAYDRDAAKGRFDRETILSLGMDPEDLRLVTARKAFGLPARPDPRRT
ncbi:fatty acid hydroxylase family protein [Hasllibacter halocynthiae]|uniref:Fatty acid hydroxylase family protein n=1 Tax=Hasllibacter halocynthiae TaxID=595589 RepID=A0A2T0X1C5_9RHOB|nr:sterol desaturase family protein [Hasllibacter halocynthiae]PRY92748.1 fatty acid hydroxylase family protein [Hasllibacter halocynthiae]